MEVKPSNTCNTLIALRRREMQPIAEVLPLQHLLEYIVMLILRRTAHRKLFHLFHQSKDLGNAIDIIEILIQEIVIILQVGLVPAKSMILVVTPIKDASPIRHAILGIDTTTPTIDVTTTTIDVTTPTIGLTTTISASTAIVMIPTTAVIRVAEPIPALTARHLMILLLELPLNIIPAKTSTPF